MGCGCSAAQSSIIDTTKKSPLSHDAITINNQNNQNNDHNNNHNSDEEHEEYRKDEMRNSSLPRAKVELIPIAVLVGRNIQSKCGIFSNDSSCVLASDDHEVMAWEPSFDCMEERRKVDQQQHQRIESVAPSEFKLLGHVGIIHDIAWSPDGLQIATCASDSYICLWHANGFDCIGGVELLGSNYSLSVTYSPGGKYLAAGCHDGTLRFFRVATQDELMVLPAHSSGVNGVKFSPNGLSIATVSDDSQLKVWDVKTGSNLCVFDGHKSSINSIAWSHDGMSLATSSDDGSIGIWSAGEALFLPSSDRALRSAIWTLDSLFVWAAGEDGIIELWDVSAGQRVYLLSRWRDWPLGYINYIRLSNDGKKLLACCALHGLIVLEIKTIEPEPTHDNGDHKTTDEAAKADTEHQPVVIEASTDTVENSKALADDASKEVERCDNPIARRQSKYADRVYIEYNADVHSDSEDESSPIEKNTQNDITVENVTEVSSAGESRSMSQPGSSTGIMNSGGIITHTTPNRVPSFYVQRSSTPPLAIEAKHEAKEKTVRSPQSASLGHVVMKSYNYASSAAGEGSTTAITSQVFSLPSEQVHIVEPVIPVTVELHGKHVSGVEYGVAEYKLANEGRTISKAREIDHSPTSSVDSDDINSEQNDEPDEDDRTNEFLYREADEIAQLRSQCDQLKDLVANLQDQLAASEESNIATTNEVEYLRNSISEYVEASNTMERVNADLRVQHAVEINRMQESFNESVREMKVSADGDIEQQRRELEESLKSLDREKTEVITKLQTEIKSMRITIENLEESNTNLQASQAVSDVQASASREHSKRENTALKDKIRALETSLQDATENGAKIDAEKLAAIEENEKLKISLVETELRAQEAEVSRRLLQEENDKLSKAKLLAEASIVGPEASKGVAEIQSLYDKLEVAQSRIEELQHENDEVVDYCRKLKSGFQEKLIEATTASDKSETDEVADYEKKKKELQELIDIRSTCSLLVSQNDELKTKLKDQLVERTNVHKELSDAKAKNDDLVADFARLTAQVSALTAALHEKDVAILRSSKEFAALRESQEVALVSEKKRFDNAVHDNSLLIAQLRDRDGELIALKQELSEAAKKLERLESQYQETLSTNRLECTEVRKLLVETEIKLQNTANQLVDSEGKSQSVSRQLNECEEHLEIVQSRAKELELENNRLVELGTKLRTSTSKQPSAAQLETAHLESKRLREQLIIFQESVDLKDEELKDVHSTSDALRNQVAELSSKLATAQREHKILEETANQRLVDLLESNKKIAEYGAALPISDPARVQPLRPTEQSELVDLKRVSEAIVLQERFTADDLKMPSEEPINSNNSTLSIRNGNLALSPERVPGRIPTGITSENSPGRGVNSIRLNGSPNEGMESTGGGRLNTSRSSTRGKRSDIQNRQHMTPVTAPIDLSARLQSSTAPGRTPRSVPSPSTIGPYKSTREDKPSGDQPNGGIHKDWVRTVAWSPDGMSIAAGDQGKLIYIWSPQDLGADDDQFSDFPAFTQKAPTTNGVGKRPLLILRGHDGWVMGVSWRRDSRRLASAGFDSTVRIWHAKTGELQRILRVDERQQNFHCVSWTFDGNWIAAGSTRNTIAVWRAGDGLLYTTLRGHSDPVVALSWSPVSYRLVSASWDSTALVWNPLPEPSSLDIQSRPLKVSTRLQRAPLVLGQVGSGNYVLSAVWSPDGMCVATSSSDGLISVWDPHTGQLLHRLHGHTEQVTCLAFRPTRAIQVHTSRNTFDSSTYTLASCSADNSIMIWDTDSESLLHKLDGYHSACVTCVSWAPTGNELVSSSVDKTVRIWTRV